MAGMLKNRLLMAAAGMVIQFMTGSFLSPNLAITTDLISGVVIGLVIYEIFYWTRRWLNLKTLLLYYLLVLFLVPWLAGMIRFAIMGGPLAARFLDYLLSETYFAEYFQFLISPNTVPENVYQFLISGLFTGLAYYLVKREAPALGRDTGAAAVVTYGGAELDPAQSQTTRYLAASLLLDPSFRQQLLAMIEKKWVALAPELGIDLPMLGRVAYLLEARNRRFHLYYFLAVLPAGLFYLFGFTGIGLIVFAVAATVISFGKDYELTYQLLPLLKKKGYTPGRFEQVLENRYSVQLLPRLLPTPDQNLVVYQGFMPFVGCGAPLGSWSFSINAGRPKEELGLPQKVIPFELVELYQAVEQTIQKSGFEGFVARDALFVNGRDIRQVNWILPVVETYPATYLNEERLNNYLGRRDSLARHYKWFQVYDWSNELVVSYFMRLFRSGDYIFIEVSRFLLPPLRDEYRRIDSLSPPTGRTPLALAFTSLLLGPFKAIFGALLFVLDVLNGIEKADLLGFRRQSEEKIIKKDKNFDYGAAATLRSKVSTPFYNHYFQKLDQEVYVKVLEKQIIEGINNFLDEHNVDTSDIREQQRVILNAGVIVQGGNVQAGAIAVGSRAQASVERQPAVTG